MIIRAVAGALASLLCVSLSVAGVITDETPLASIGFQNITNNDLGNAGIGENQLTLELFGWDGSSASTDSSSSSILFRFINSGPKDANIARIYFDNGPLAAPTMFVYAPGGPMVKFQYGANPPVLPGGEDLVPKFLADTSLSVSSVNPPPKNGVGASEELGVVFSLSGSRNVSDVIEALNMTDGVDPLRIGIHVIGFEDGGSESFVTVPTTPLPPPDEPNPLPEPSSLAVFGLITLGAMTTMALRRRRTLAAA